jgi:pyridoxine 5-phosphate synthase
MRLGLNIDHIATIRQARRAREPEPVTAALMAELAGAEGITVHLRGDRRHIQDRDVELLRQVVATKLNIEMAATPEMVGIACRVKPDQVTLVPERPDEVTTTGGLDVIQHAGVPHALGLIHGESQSLGQDLHRRR